MRGTGERIGRARRAGALVGVALLVLARIPAPAIAVVATDTDRDGLTDTFETTRSLTSPTNADTDGNGVRDDAEDPDRDWLTNLQEQTAGLHPRLRDTDGDRIPDGEEDQDGDSLRTAFEFRALTHPLLADTDDNGRRDPHEDPDQDGLTNLQEQLSGTHPRRGDTDGDRLADGQEDPDADTLWNRTEFRATTLPRDADTDDDGIGDGREDPDLDGVGNTVEQRLSLNPRAADSDGDGTRDGDEDPDEDGLTTLVELSIGTDPGDSDSDNDGTPDGDETIALPPTVAGAPNCPVFPASNAWNLRVDALPVAGNSATMVSSIGLDRGLHMDFGSYAGYGIPINIISSATPRRSIAFDYADESDLGPYPIPASPRIEGGSDRHLLALDKDTCTLYELYAVRQTVGGAWQAGSGAIWDLRSNALRPAGWTSADAAGLPIVPGLVRYEEVAAGEIRHALRFTAPQTRNTYIYPARHYASSSSSASLPPMGLRVRLKANADLSGLSPYARTIAIAMQRYGMLLADNGSPWYVTGQSDARFDDDVLHELDRFTGRNFEVVDTSGLRNGP